MGISKANLAYSVEAARGVARHILHAFQQPVLVEHFVHGTEATVVLFGIGAQVDIFQAFEVYDPSGAVDTVNTIWTWEDKQLGATAPRKRKPLELHPDDVKALRRLFSDFGRLHLARVDGRISNGRFHFVEINCEPYLGSKGSVAEAFAMRGLGYDEMFRRFLLPFEVERR